MRNLLNRLSLGFPAWPAVAVSLTALLLAGCSSSIDRFADYPGESDRTHTASAPSSGRGSASDDVIQSGPIGDASSSRNQVQKVYRPPNYQPAGRYDASTKAPAGDGSVVVAPGQTLYSIARTSGKSVQAVAAANGIQPPYHVKAGQRILIPGGVSARARVELAKARPAASFQQGSSVHAVQPGDTLFSLGRRYKLHPYAIADLNGLSHNSPLRLGQKVRIPAGGRQVASAPTIATDASVIDEEPSVALGDDVDAAIGGTGKSQQRIEEEPSPGGAQSPEDDSSAVDEPAMQQDTARNFRWPVKGRVISTFGAKPGGMRNEGINIAVPEGTSIRAADSGVVAYAGNELKGYGNLVLIRHQDGWVTAYAHNKELAVKRGDTVKRGDLIARAGRTGSVESPQLHFELRKGATAVDPIKYLASTVAN
jgi:murein DD-endopeptidase MepM/ murein hydrolase activator NlpD